MCSWDSNLDLVALIPWWKISSTNLTIKTRWYKRDKESFYHVTTITYLLSISSGAFDPRARSPPVDCTLMGRCHRVCVPRRSTQPWHSQRSEASGSPCSWLGSTRSVASFDASMVSLMGLLRWAKKSCSSLRGPHRKKKVLRPTWRHRNARKNR
jgi:hypothetical protein